MTLTPKEINVSLPNISSPPEDIKKEIYSSTNIGEKEEKQILDLLATPVSPNRISRHFKNVFREQRKAHAVRNVLLKRHRRIKLVNHKFDLIAINAIRLLEIDETFKGRRVSLLVIIDTWSGYILHLGWLQNRSKEGILKVLEPISYMFLDIMLVLTDGATYFPEVVKELCPHAIHQICLVHVLRGLFKTLRLSQNPYIEVKKEVKQSKKMLANHEKSIKNRAYKLKKHRQKYRYWSEKRNSARQQYNVRPYQKNIWRMYPKLKLINDKINSIAASIRCMEKSTQNARIKRANLINQINQSKELMFSVWGNYITDWRFLRQFINIFDLKSEKFNQAKTKYIVILLNAKSELGHEIVRVLTTIKNIDSVKTPDSPVQLRKSWINTNMIESTNSRIRPYLEAFRKIDDTEYSKAYFGLIRLFLNTCMVFSGFRKGTSPVGRLGYSLRGRTYLDIIFCGFPPGPQYGLNSAKLDPSVVNPKRAKETIILENSVIYQKL